jgi:hypothetical protein
MIFVYHLTDTAALEMGRIPFQDGKALVRHAAGLLEYGTGYELVATVEGSDLEQAWNLTNNVNSSWSLEPARGVEVLGKLPVAVNGRVYGHRSSMVGDVFQVDGGSFVVAGVGFLPLPVAG